MSGLTLGSLGTNGAVFLAPPRAVPRAPRVPTRQARQALAPGARAPIPTRAPIPIIYGPPTPPGYVSPARTRMSQQTQAIAARTVQAQAIAARKGRTLYRARRRAWAREQMRRIQAQRLAAALREARRRGWFSMNRIPGFTRESQAAYDAASEVAGQHKARVYWARQARREKLAANQAAKLKSALRGDLGVAAKAAAERLVNPPRGITMVEFEMRAKARAPLRRPALPRRVGRDQRPIGLSVPQRNILSEMIQTF